jgi:tRNA modification GTPase
VSGTPPGEVVVAAATAPGRAALAVVRLTGPGLDAVLARVLRTTRGTPLPDRAPRRVWLSDAEGTIDDGVAVAYRGPRTYTGEDLCEVTVHGNPLVVERAVQAFVSAGARLAGPGEFTRRAVVNGRMDLVAAEAVDQLVRARSPAGLAVARAGLDGRTEAAVAPVRAQLLEAAAELEARLDWPGDELALADDAALVANLEAARARCLALAATHAAGRVRVEGARVALVGAVNAGKSSLFNALLGRPRALVHDAPGTTRDVLEVAARLGPLEVTLLDTAGERVTDDPVEVMGQALARELVAEADLLLVVLRARSGPDPLAAELLARTADRPRLVVWNGVDTDDTPAPPGALATSARTGDGVAALATAVVSALGGDQPSGELLLASARQRDRLLAVAHALGEALEGFGVAGPAVAAERVTAALAELEAFGGTGAREAVLDAVFARFCIGK